MKKSCRFNSLQKIVRSIPKCLPVLIQPNFKHSLHAREASRIAPNKRSAILGREKPKRLAIFKGIIFLFLGPWAF